MENLMYFDNNSTTPLDPRVFEKMKPFFTEFYGNSSSTLYRLGRESHTAIDHSRAQVAQLLNCQADEITFTSGATESISTLLQGVFHLNKSKGQHYVTCKTEHKAVLENFKFLEKQGAIVNYLDVNEKGEINLDELKKAIQPDTVLVAIMAANNETGVLHPIEKIAKICLEREVLYFCDATQQIGKLPLNLEKIPIDLLCFSSHKIYGPKGVGGHFIRKRTKRIQVQPLILGGKQENGNRSGTQNVPGIVGLGFAAEYAQEELSQYASHTKNLRDLFEREMKKTEELLIHGNTADRLPNVSNIEVSYLNTVEIISASQSFAFSMGSACSTENLGPSHVLRAMNLSDQACKSSLRISFGKQNTENEVLQFIKHLQEIIPNLRSKSPYWQIFKAGLWT